MTHILAAMMKMFCALSLFLLTAVTATQAAEEPYNEKADAKSDIRLALSQAAEAKKSIIVVFGANWCGDCKLLDAVLKSHDTAALLSQDFQIVKVNVGRFNTNLDLATAYGISLDKGIPAVAVISTNNTVLYATKEGELADARKMGAKAVHEFFKRMATESTVK